MDEWWRGAVIYQIYPRSYQDTKGDGVGDLPGIVRHLDYVARLGVDAVWVSPFFKSPMKDFGYDVEDYCAVDPMFGMIEDFDRLVERAHELGLKVMVDLVLSHTSDRHPWFAESRRSRDNAKADWYVWADPRPDGSPPNNWLSIFGGPAWHWDTRRRQYYLRNFLVSQPDLNLHNPKVVDALLRAAEFWLERGVDGFRLDACDFYLHDEELRDNPVREPGTSLPGGLQATTPYALQLHVYDKAHPRAVEIVLGRLRALAERFPGSALLGELSGDGAQERAAAYSQGRRALHMTYTFELFHAPFTAAGIRAAMEPLEAILGDGWACWSFGNHDVVRPVTRWGGPSAPEGLRRLLPVLLASLRGSVCLYQGEELGLDEAELAFEELVDPFGIEFYPEVRSRDGARTPMPWSAALPHGGFSAVRPWLPVPAAHLERAVDVQEHDPSSVLAHTRAFLRWRRERPALRVGSIAFLDADEPLLAFERRLGDEALVCLFNLGAAPLSYAPPTPLRALYGDAQPDAETLNLPGYGVCFAAPANREREHG